MAEAVHVSASPALPVRRIDVERPWRWLADGWRDLMRAPNVGFAYGALFAAGGFVLTLGLWLLEMLYLVLPLAAGFMLIAPLFAVGLYETSRRLELGMRPTLGNALVAWRVRIGSLATIGLILMLFLLAWIRIAFLIFALFFGVEPPSWNHLVTTIFFSLEGLPFLAVGTAVGGVFAAIAFAVSAVSISLLLDRDVGVLAAIATSVSAVWMNWRVMIGWAALIVLFTGAGIVTAYIGLAVTLPLIGHATWHAYRDLVADDGAQTVSGDPKRS